MAEGLEVRISVCINENVGEAEGFPHAFHP